MNAKKNLDDKLDRLDTFVLAGVATVLITRGFLYISGFPQIGSDSLHVAHVLWGGAFLSIAFLFLLLGDKPNKIIAALLGGIGFGLFIDEVGKFITQDNDYFYRPAFTLMYIAFLGIWFLSRLIIVRQAKSEFLSPAEWPRQKWLGALIVVWIGAQAAAGIIIFLLTLDRGFSTVNDFIGITGLGMLASVVYAFALALGLYRLYQRKILEAAHVIRGATIFAILVMYPFIFFHYPVTGIIGILITLPVTIALSQLAVSDLLRNLYRFNGQ